ncbi:copia protein [Tanacetum coccineum]
MYYPRFTKVIIHHFLIQEKSISWRNKIGMHTSKDDYLINTLRFVSRKEASQIYGAVLPECLTSPEMKESKAYKTYLGYATGEVPPKVARKFKKASPSKKESELVPGDEEPVKKGKRLKTPAKKSASKPTTGIELLSEVALLEKAQMKEVRKKSLRNFHKTHPSGSGTVAEKPPSVEKITPTVTSEGTGDKPGVPDVTNDDSSESESESWGNDEDDSNNEQESSDESSKQENESEEQESDSEQDEESDDDDQEEEEFDQENESEDDEMKSDEEQGMDDTTDQFDDDADARLEEPTKTATGIVQGKGNDTEMTEAQQGNENLETTQEQVVEDAHVTISTVPKKTEVPVTSSSRSSDLASKFLNFSDIPQTNAEIVSPLDVHVHHEFPRTQALTLLTIPVLVIPESSPVFTNIPQSSHTFTPTPIQATPTPPPIIETTNPLANLPDFSLVFQFNDRITALEKEVADLKKDPLHTQVTSLVDSHLDTRLGETRQEFMNFLSESLMARIKEQLKDQLPQILPQEVSNFASPVIEKLIKESRDEVTLAKVSSQPQSTCKAAFTLTEFELKKILLDKMEKNFFYSYDVYSLKCGQKDKDKDEDPSTGSDQGLKKRKLSKDAEPTTGPQKENAVRTAVTPYLMQLVKPILQVQLYAPPILSIHPFSIIRSSFSTLGSLLHIRIAIVAICDVTACVLDLFVSRKEASQRYGAVLPDCLTSPEMKESKAYKTYLGFATGAVPPKVARKFKKASPSKKDSVHVPGDEEPVLKGKRFKRAAKKSSTTLATGIIIRESPVTTKAKGNRKENVDVAHGKGIEQLSNVVLITPIVTSEGTSDKPGVPDVTNDDSSKSETESWGNDEDDSNEEQESGDEGSDQEKASDEQESDSEQDDDDNDQENEESDHENESEDDETKSDEGDQGMDDTTDQEREQGNENLATNQEQVVEDAHVTISTIPKKTEEIVSPLDVHVHHEVPRSQAPTLLIILVSVIPKSSPVITNIPQSSHTFTPIPIQATPTPPPTIETTNPLSNVPDFASIFQFNDRIIALENDVAELKKDHFHTQVTSLVDSHLDARLGETRAEFMNILSESLTARIKEQVKDQLPQILPQEVSNLAPHVIETMIRELRDKVNLARSSSQPQYTYEAASTLTEFELKKILIDKMEKSESYLPALEHRDCYDGLKKSYAHVRTKELIILIIPQINDGSSKGNHKSQNKPRSSGKSVQLKEPEFEVGDSDMPQDQAGIQDDNADEPRFDTWNVSWHHPTLQANLIDKPQGLPFQ